MHLDMTSHVLFIIIAVAAVAVDGWFIRRSGVTYLAEVHPDRRVADSANRLISALFVTFMLGVVALASLPALPAGNPVHQVILRLGVVLLVMALAHATTIWSFARIRTQQRSQRLNDEIARTHGPDLADEPTTAPVKRGIPGSSA
ncbi:hypothetical protein SAMN05421805_102353 [Saccharopolyspora antimicrobica]|uniref:Uncharacterized protein n=1 Tax=Saccharopolyspora antimicrobica TaxID=455193 RepID=A0A1I4VRZ2_9PSEU|nr:hypothetical protein [Saccharopolyspora antimicrobica]RKT87234.1 hypothetical protein ATL45_5634 [Saccharopolyspora antimicrobica]SFN04024.1 hypothetical protein SAMN05421805_102353 [Saccharopolyspora antimicrobica]